jgi:hypothetical protein
LFGIWRQAFDAQDYAAVIRAKQAIDWLLAGETPHIANSGPKAPPSDIW